MNRKRLYGRGKSRKELTLTSDSISYLEKAFSRNQSDGADRCIHAHRVLLRACVSEVRGVFLKHELQSIVLAHKLRPLDIFSQHLPGALVSMLKQAAEDGSVEFALLKKTVDKIVGLSKAQVHFMREAIDMAINDSLTKPSAIDDLIEDLRG
jgi:hypothetical protein